MTMVAKETIICVSHTRKEERQMKKALCIFLLLFVLSLTACGCEHTFGEYEVQTPATCSAPGVEARVCSKCSESESREIAMLDHTYGEWETTKEATCVDLGEKTLTCSVCNAAQTKEISLIDHDYGEWETTKEATCIALGEKVSTCSVCNTTQTKEIPLIDHDFGEWETTKEATCIALGEKTSTCSVCNAVQTEEIQFVDHVYGEWKTITPANCTSGGTKVHNCTVCGVEEKGTISATGHNYEKTVLAKTTCTSDGTIKYTCANCKHTYEETSPATGHKWSAATCTAPKTCTSCGTTEGSKLGHNAGSNGKCTRCGEKITIDMKTKISAPTEKFAILRGQNSVGLVELNWTADNNSGKTIKYYTVTCYYYNAVGDPARNDITGKTSYTVKYVGPVEPGGMLLVGDIGYCDICSEVVVGEITLEYTDGTTDTGWYGYRIKIP